MEDISILSSKLRFMLETALFLPIETQTKETEMILEGNDEEQTLNEPKLVDREDISRFEVQNIFKTKEIAELKQKFERLLSQVHMKEDANKCLREEIKNLKLSNEKMNEEMDATRKESSQNLRLLKSMQTEFEFCKSMNARIQESFSAFSVEFMELKSVHEKLQQRFSDKSKELLKLQLEIDGVKENERLLQESLIKEKGINASLRAQISTFTEQIQHEKEMVEITLNQKSLIQEKMEGEMRRAQKTNDILKQLEKTNETLIQTVKASKEAFDQESMRHCSIIQEKNLMLLDMELRIEGKDRQEVAELKSSIETQEGSQHVEEESEFSKDMEKQVEPKIQQNETKDVVSKTECGTLKRTRQFEGEVRGKTMHAIVDSDSDEYEQTGCYACHEASFGFMVVCQGCGRTYHSSCAKKIRNEKQKDTVKFMKLNEFVCNRCENMKK